MSNIVIIPTYKEKENIEAIIKAISCLSVSFDILIIDDNSPDGTGDIVKDLKKSYKNLHLIERPGKLGLALHMLQVLNGRLRRAMILYMRWMQTFLTIHMTL